AFPINDPLAWAVGILTLHQSAYLTDVLLFYTLAVAFAPLPMLFFRRKQTAAVLAASSLLWAAYQLWPDLVQLPWPIERQDAFPFAAWQLLFVMGLALGWHEQRVRQALQRIPVPAIALGLLAALGGLLAAFHLSVPLGQAVGGPLGFYLADLFYKFDLRPGRVLALLVVFGLFYLVLTLFWRPINAGVGWLLLPLGQHALDAYSVHIFFVVILGATRVRLGPEDALSTLPNTILQLACVLIIWALVRYGVIDWMLGRTRTSERQPAVAGAV
ncbi:MAG: OpgC domain-containing protein, partial [Chloroflexota bacterium]|nr:OpgC domain-containing protein [Chloroflexota bacterium]